MSTDLSNTSAQSAASAANNALTSTSSSNLTAATSTATDQSLTSLANNFGSFLSLLTTQLQNQDPLSPMETHEFTNQLVMFAEAEQAIATNQKLDTMIGLGQKDEAIQALSYYGKEVRVNGNQLSFHGEPVKFQYTAPNGVVSGNMVVRDAAGKTVFEKELITSDLTDGAHNMTWDGRNAFGYQLAEGLYTFTISGKDAAGTAVTMSNINVTASVKGVEHTNNVTSLNMGHYKIGLDKVASITTPAFQVEDQVRAMSFVGSNVHITGTTAAVKGGKLSLAYDTSGITNFSSSLNSEALNSVKLKFYDRSGTLMSTEDITAKMDTAKLAGGEKRLDMTISGLTDNSYRVEMEVNFAGSGTEAGSTFNKIPMGYSGKVRRVVFDNGAAKLEINNVLYNPSDVGSVINSEIEVFKLT